MSSFNMDKPKKLSKETLEDYKQRIKLLLERMAHLEENLDSLFMKSIYEEVIGGSDTQSDGDKEVVTKNEEQ